MTSIYEIEDTLWQKLTREERIELNTELHLWMSTNHLKQRTLCEFCCYYKFRVSRLQVSDEVVAWMEYCMSEPSL